MSAKMNVLKNQKWNTAILFVSILLFVSSILHRLQIDLPGQGYIRSIFVHIEMWSMILLFMMNLINVIVFIVFLVQKYWRKALVTFLVGICSTVLMIVSMQIDAPTLIYMT